MPDPLLGMMGDKVALDKDLFDPSNRNYRESDLDMRRVQASPAIVLFGPKVHGTISLHAAPVQ